MSAFDDAKKSATAIRKRLTGVTQMMQANPNLVRIATDQNTGDQIAFWYGDFGAESQYNLTQAHKKLSDLVSQHGEDVLKSRSGNVIKIELPI